MVFRIIEANEGILAFGVCRVLLDADGLDETVLAEYLMNLVLVPLWIKVFDVEIVGNCLKIFGVFGVVLENLDITELSCPNDCLGVLLTLECDKTDPTRYKRLSFINKGDFFALRVDIIL